MNKYLLTYIALIVTCNTFSQINEFKQSDITFINDKIHFKKDNSLANGVMKNWHENGQLALECTVKNGELHDTYKQWYKDGQLQYNQNYINGKLQGVSRTWYANGQLYSHINNDIGKKNGEVKVWYKNGQLNAKGFYKQDNLEGVYKEWHENGLLKTESNYKDGKKHGSTKIFHPSGGKNSEAIFKDGEITFEKLYMPGGKELFTSSFYEINYKNGKKTIVKTFYDYKLYSESHYANGKEVSTKYYD